MHNTEVKTEVIQNQEQQLTAHHSQPNVSHRRITNGDGMGSAGTSSRHHREVGTTLAMTPSNSTNECAGCGKRITDRFLLKALDLFWHEDCLKCGCCDCRLGEVGSTLYTKANLILCKRDYLRLFGNTGYCAACSKVIPAFEMVMRARNNVYHLECFACQQCNHRFCVGDRFYLCENKILCEYDYEERMVFANMACSPGNLALLRRQVSTFQSAGSQGEQQQQSHQHLQQQQQQQFQPSSSGSILGVNCIDQFQQFDQQPKYTLPFPIAKIPVGESLGISYSTLASSSPPPPPSNNPGAEAGYITKQPRATLNKDRTDSFFNVKCTPSLSLSPPPPPAKRPKQSYPTFDTSDNLDSSSIIQYSERNNNTNHSGNGSGRLQLFLPTPSSFNPLFVQAVREAEDLLGTGTNHRANKAVNLKTAGSSNCSSNNAMGSPDSGIVEGP